MSFQQGLSGLNAASRQLDVIGNNVANASTVGFKSSEATFSDVYANSLGTTASSNTGLGVTVSSIQGNFAQGNITATTNPLDIAINGNGFFRMDTNGVTSYSRTGQFHIDNNGYIVNATGSKLTGYGVDATGVLVGANTGPLQVSSADITPTATTQGHITLNLDSREAAITIPFDVNNPKTYNKSTAMTTYDSLGNPHTESTYYVKTAANTWDVYGSQDGAAGTKVGTLKFKSDGTLDTTATTLPFNISNPLTNGATTTFDWTLDYYGSTQFGSAFGASSITQDGSTSGQLAGLSASDDGTLVGRYSNGQSKVLGQIALANFTNMEGLQPLSNNAYAETSASGQPTLGAPGSSSLGVLQSGAVEESNVDLTKELVDMITAQRVYQANAQTIKTQDQVLNTLVNLR
jgi:flagellar hook protein FlgE